MSPPDRQSALRNWNLLTPRARLRPVWPCTLKGCKVIVCSDPPTRTLAPTANAYALGALAGDYVGASAEATAAVGVGANVLVGGSEQTMTLQPLSVQGQTGLNLALGVSKFQLRSAL